MLRRLLPLVLLAPLSACADDNYAERVELSHVDRETEPDAPFHNRAFSEAYVMDTANAVTGTVTIGDTLDAFAAELAAKLEAADRVAVFPLVTHGLRRDGPWVSELGLRLSDDLAERLRGRAAGRTLTTPELDVAIARKGLKKAQFASLPAAVDDAAALEVDVVVFGTIKRENNQPVNGRDLLTFDLAAMRVRSGEQVARTRFQAQSDKRENLATFDLAARDSLWLVEQP